MGTALLHTRIGIVKYKVLSLSCDIRFLLQYTFKTNKLTDNILKEAKWGTVSVQSAFLCRDFPVTFLCVALKGDPCTQYCYCGLFNVPGHLLIKHLHWWTVVVRCVVDPPQQYVQKQRIIINSGILIRATAFTLIYLHKKQRGHDNNLPTTPPHSTPLHTSP